MMATESTVRGHHIFKDTWKPYISKKPAVQVASKTAMCLKSTPWLSIEMNVSLVTFHARFKDMLVLPSQEAQQDDLKITGHHPSLKVSSKVASCSSTFLEASRKTNLHIRQSLDEATTNLTGVSTKATNYLHQSFHSKFIFLCQPSLYHSHKGVGG